MSRRTVKESVVHQFSEVAIHYANSPVHSAGVDLAKMVEIARLSRCEQVLDAGCGAGHTALALAPHAQEVVALDLSTSMLAEVRRLAHERNRQNIRTELGDVEHLAFADDRFDLVTSRYSAHHWPRPQAALAEFRRVLCPGGRLLLSDIVSYDSFAADSLLQTIEVVRDPSHVRDHTIPQWQAMMAAAGLQSTVCMTWPLRIDFTSWVERMATPPENVAMLRRVLDSASREVRTELAVEADHSFTLIGALFEARAA